MLKRMNSLRDKLYGLAQTELDLKSQIGDVESKMKEKRYEKKKQERKRKTNKQNKNK